LKIPKRKKLTPNVLSKEKIKMSFLKILIRLTIKIVFFAHLFVPLASPKVLSFERKNKNVFFEDFD